MRGGDHLREIDDDGMVVLIDHDVELVEVSMNHTTVAQAHYQVHQLVVQAFRVRYWRNVGSATMEINKNKWEILDKRFISISVFL